MKRFIMLFLLIIFSTTFGFVVIASGNKLVKNQEYENIMVDDAGLLRKYVIFKSNGYAEYGDVRYIIDKKKAYNPNFTIVYKGKKYYYLGSQGGEDKYTVNGSDVTIKCRQIIHDDDGELQNGYLDFKWYVKSDGRLQIVESPFYYNYPVGSKYVLSSTKRQSENTEIKLSKTKVTSNGKAQKPAVTVKYGGKKLSTKYYTVSYSSNKYPGLATITVKGKGAYKNKITTTKLNFVIIPPKMKPPTVKAGKASLKINCKTEQKVSGYQIQISLNKDFKSNEQKVTVTSSKTKQIKGLKSKKNYYIRTRAYKMIEGTKYYGSWSSVKKVKTK